MEAFEYIVQLVAILVGLALADLAMSLHKLLRGRARVRWHWHAPATALVLVLLTLDIWWGLRLAENAKITWTIGIFLPQLFGLLGFFLLAAASFPDEVPADGLDLKTHYQGNARYFWLLFAGVTLLFTGHTVMISSIALGGAELGALLPRFASNFAVVLAALSLAFVRASWWHSLVILLLIAAMLASYVARPLA